MRRLVVVLSIALVMAAMMVAMAMPAFADHSAGHYRGQDTKENKHSCQDVQLRPGVSECTLAFFFAEGPK